MLPLKLVRTDVSMFCKMNLFFCLIYKFCLLQRLIILMDFWLNGGLYFGMSSNSGFRIIRGMLKRYDFIFKKILFGNIFFLKL